MMGWLGDTEGMVASQKAPSTDYKVVKAQVAEQKFLQRMIDDRAGSVTNMEEIGREIAMSGKPGDSDPQQVEEQMAQLLGMCHILIPYYGLHIINVGKAITVCSYHFCPPIIRQITRAF